MTARWPIALGVYAVLMATLVTPLYEPLSDGRDDSWLILLLPAGALFGLGAAIGRLWALTVPVALCLVGFFASGAGEGLSALFLVFALPASLIVTALGVAAGMWAERGGSGLLLGGSVALALVPVVWAGLEQLHRATAPHVSAEIQRKLPTGAQLGDLCLGSELPRRDIVRLQRSGEVLIDDVKRRPGSLVTNSYVPADEPGVERRNITVRELAEEQLRSLDGEHCAPRLERRLARALR